VRGCRRNGIKEEWTEEAAMSPASSARSSTNIQELDRAARKEHVLGDTTEALIELKGTRPQRCSLRKISAGLTL
jgi:hypothetical protein